MAHRAALYFLLSIKALLACLPTTSPDDMTEITTIAPTTAATTINPNDMCQYCPNIEMCDLSPPPGADRPPAAVSCFASPTSTVVRGNGQCMSNEDCRTLFPPMNRVWYKDSSTNMWVTYNSPLVQATCADPMGGWVDPMGNAIQYWVCASP